MLHVLTINYRNHDEADFRVIGVFHTAERATEAAENLLVSEQFRRDCCRGQQELERDDFVITTCVLNGLTLEMTAFGFNDHPDRRWRLKDPVTEAAKIEEAKDRRVIRYVPIPGNPKRVQVQIRHSVEDPW